MKQFLLGLFMGLLPIIGFGQKDSISIQELKIIQLEEKVEDLNKELAKNHEHIKELLAENEKLSDSNFEKVDSRLTNFIWLISVIGGLVVATLTFFGWKYLSSSIKNFFNERAQTIADNKLDDLITEEWLTEKFEQKAEPLFKKSIEKLQSDFIAIGEQMIDEEKQKIQKQAKDAVNQLKLELEERRKELKDLEIGEKTEELSEDQKRKIKEFDETLENAKDIEEFTANDWFWKGRNEVEGKKYKEAINSFRQALEKKPEEYLNHTWLGYSYLSIKEYDKALQFINSGIKLGANHESVWNNRGFCNMHLQNFIEAKEDLDKALKINPEYPNSYCHRSYVNLQLDNIKSALNDANKAIELNSNYGNAYFNLGLIHLANKEIKKACESWKKALELGFIEAQEKLDEFCEKP